MVPGLESFATVGVDALAGDERRLVGGKIHRKSSELGRLTEAPHWDPRKQLATDPVVVMESRAHRRSELPWGDRVDRDSETSPLVREAAC